MKQWWRKYGASLFVVVGLAVVGLTVTQIQRQQLTFTQAAGEDEAKALGIWWDPSPAYAVESGGASLRLKLDSLSQVMTRARVVFNYDPQMIIIDSIDPGPVFGGQVEISHSPGRLALVSEGEFLGVGTWVKLQVRRQGIEAAKLVSDPQLSEFQYSTGQTVQVGEFDVEVRKDK